MLLSDHRGETVRLPGATRWTMADGTVAVETPDAAQTCVVEVAVAAADLSEAVARLRAQGHQVLRVREEVGS